MTYKKWIQIIICLTTVAAILIPALTLFNWGDYLYCSFDAPANQKVMIEVLILAGIIAAVSFLIKQRKTRLLLLILLTLVFCYVHGMLLPVLVAGIYFLAVMSIGSLVTGIAAVIITAGLLSLAGWCTPLKLGLAVIVIAVIVSVIRKLNGKRRGCRKSFNITGDTSKWQLLINAVVLLVVLVQIGRAQTAVKDFDSLWYGLRSEHVLAPGGSIFENLGLVGMVYTYSKGYEILTLPLSAFKSYGYIPVFNTCLFICGLIAVYDMVSTMCGQSYTHHHAFFCLERKADDKSSQGVNQKAESKISQGVEQKAKCDLYKKLTDKAAGMAVIITAVIPGIVNMCVSAKPDIATWLLQLLMIDRFFAFVKAGDPGTTLMQSAVPSPIHPKGLQSDDSVVMMSGKSRLSIFLEILAAYLLSLTMKPTSVIFSTALAGMMLIWWIIDMIADRGKQKHERTSNTSPRIEPCEASNASLSTGSGASSNASQKTQSCAAQIVSSIAALAALCVVWGRTILLTGVPFTSVFTGLLTGLGFELKYPFASSDLPTRFKGDSIVKLVGKRAAKMLLSPEGDDMGHVSIAWSGSIMLVLGVVIVICIIVIIAAASKTKHKANIGDVKRTDKFTGTDAQTDKKADTDESKDKMPGAVAILFIPYAIVSAATLAMLSQVDGNYYMTLYSIVIVSAMWLSYEALRRSIPYMRTGAEEYRLPAASERKTPIAVVIAATAMIAFQFFIMLLTNWASAPGFAPIGLTRIYYDNENDTRIMMTSQADPESMASGTTIYDILGAQPRARVLAVGEHPFCLQFNCVVQSYGDMANPWGNPELENSTEEFLYFLHFAKVDYIYADMEYLDREECTWRKGMIEELTAGGFLTDPIYEGSGCLMRVR